MEPARVLAVLFADVSGSTSLYERLGDRAALAAVESVLSLLKRVVAGQRGRVVKTIGDEVMAVFESADAALQAASSGRGAWPASYGMDHDAAKSGLMAQAAAPRQRQRSESAMDDPGEVRFETSEVLRLFPVFVWKAQLAADVCRPINAAIRELLAELAPGAPAPGTLWQSGHALHRRTACATLVRAIEAAVREVLEFLKIGDREFAITGCWANVAAPGGWHRMHAHPNNFLSGVYYVQVQEGAETIAFHDPRPQASVLRPPVTELTAYNTDQVIVKVAVGTLLVFPAWLPHSVDSNRSARSRISVSFNVMFSDLAEQLAPPLWGEV